jgi:hypothetical protein
MKTVTTSLAISSLLFPLFLFAQTTTTTSSNFCEQLDTILMRLDSQSISVQAKALPKNNSAVKNDVLLGNIAAKRTEVETAKQVLLNELQVRVKTSKQQTALEKFALDARNATLAKNEALDQLIKNNESQILETLKLRDLEVNKAVNTLKATLEASKVRARADCASGIPPQTARVAYAGRFTLINELPYVDTWSWGATIHNEQVVYQREDLEKLRVLNQPWIGLHLSQRNYTRSDDTEMRWGIFGGYGVYGEMKVIQSWTLSESGSMARELWMLAKGTGTRPVTLLFGERAKTFLPLEALAVDLTVYRAARTVARMRLDAATAADKTGWNALVRGVEMVAEE